MRPYLLTHDLIRRSLRVATQSWRECLQAWTIDMAAPGAMWRLDGPHPPCHETETLREPTIMLLLVMKRAQYKDAYLSSLSIVGAR